MFRFSSIAASATLAASMMFGGCASQDLDEPLATESRPVSGHTLHDIPAEASVMKEGHEPLLFEAPSDGTVWVYDASDRRLVYTGAIRAGQTVHVDPDHDFVLMNGKKVMDMKMDDFDKHQILFAPAAVTAGSRIEPPPAVIVQPDAVKIQQQPGEVRVKGNEVEVQPSGVKVTPQQ